MTSLTHRIKVKIGSAEFDAEGSAELVKAQFAEFMAAVSQMPKPSALESKPAVPPSTPAESTASAEGGGGENEVNGSAIPKALIARVFRSGEPLSLMATPKTDNAEADGLLVLVYGHTEMKGVGDVTGTALAKSASKTGIDAGRISRTLAARGEFIRTSGVKKGTRYSLNNRGIAEAERLIKSMVE